MTLSQRIERLEKREREKLKPCPFCPIRESSPILDDSCRDHRIICANCAAESDKRKCNEIDRTKSVAIKHWNTRPDMTEALSIIRELRERLEALSDAASTVILKTHEKLEANPWPHKFISPYAELNELHKALTATDLTQPQEQNQ